MKEADIRLTGGMGLDEEEILTRSLAYFTYREQPFQFAFSRSDKMSSIECFEPIPIIQARKTIIFVFQ